LKPVPGMLLWVALGRRLPPGHEQQGERPACLVGVPSLIGTPRFPMLLVAPVTSWRDQPWARRAPGLYPRLAAGVANLPQASIVLLDQLQTVDARRVTRFLGQLGDGDYAPIADSLKKLLGLNGNQEGRDA